MSLSLPGSSLPAPLADLGVVTHIGSLDPSDKGVRGESYEGLGVSFSLHPEDWEAIASLGGQPWWEVDLGGCRIVDGHRACELAGEGLASWAVSAGLVTPAQEFVLTYEDSEWEEQVQTLFRTHEEALAEVEGMDDAEYQITSRPGWAPTARLLEAMGHDPRRAGRPDLDAMAAVLTVWAQEQGFDGVWWEDDYNPERLSAPRGVVFAPKVPDLSFECVRAAPALVRGPRP